MTNYLSIPFQKTPFCTKIGRTASLLLPGYPFILVSGGNSTPNVTFCFVDLHDLLYLEVQCVITRAQPFRQILVYSGFADAKLFGCSADGCAVFDDVHGQIAGPFLHEVLQSQHSLHIVLKQCMQG